MKTRPAFVAAHSVPVLLGARSVAETEPPVRSAPYAVPARPPGWLFPGGPASDTKSPQAGSSLGVVNSGQFASRYAWSPPQSCVLQTCREPSKIVPATAGFGSATIGA